MENILIHHLSIDTEDIIGKETIDNNKIDKSLIIMKTVKCLILAAVASVALSVCAFAQESNRDADGNIIRGPYQTNSFWDNWFVSVNGGINLFEDFKHDFYGRPTLAAEFNFGKWFSPVVGARMGIQGLSGKEYYKPIDLTETMDYYYVHGDLLWNLSNELGGYRSDRFYSLVPYAHAGYLRLYNVLPDRGWSGTAFRTPNPWDNELAGGVGFLNLFRISNRVNLSLDLREMIYSSRYHNWQEGGIAHNFSGMLGVQINLGKTTWSRFNKDLVAANAALAAAYDQIEKLKNAPKEKEIVEVIKEVPQEGDTKLVPLALGIAPITLFYEINHTELNVTERAHLDFYVQNILNLDPNRVFYLTGTADKGTGTTAINERLSQGRVQNLIDLLVKEYGISRDRLVLKAAKIVEDNADPRLDRSVIIEH